MKVIQRDFLPTDLAPLLSENGVNACVAVQADQSEAETAFLLELSNQCDFIRGIVGWIDLKSDQLEKLLENHKKNPKIKGFRHIAQAEPEGFLLRKDILQGIQILGKHHYTYDILLAQGQLHDAIKLLEKLPHQAFIVDHCAKPNLFSKELKKWKENIASIAQNKNVYCKVSGLLTESPWQNSNEKDIFECFDVIFESFGVNRVVFGSDWPVMILGGSYTQWIHLVNKYTFGFSSQEKSLIFSENAVKFYTL